VARFVFKLEALITQRRAAEREAQLDVARLESERLLLEATLREIRASLDLERDEWRTRLHGPATGPATGRSTGLGTESSTGPDGAQGGVDVSLVRLQASASLHQVRKAQQTAVRLAGVLTRLEQARLRLVHAASERKAVERLRERRYEAWRFAEQKREDAALDEFTVMRRPAASLEAES
jgi:flagellar biosynthesis chaperone FliJ